MNTDRFKIRIWDKDKKLFDADPYDLLYTFAEVFDPLDIHIGGYHTIQQCTGLRDSNGKLIYEGDYLQEDNKISLIIQDPDNYYGLRRYLSYYWSPNDNDFVFLDAYNLCGLNNTEIIGNIFENPDLISLKEKL